MQNNQVTTTQQPNNAVAPKPQTISNLLASPAVQKRFDEILGKKSAGFISSVLAVSRQASLIGADPSTILGAAVTAASLDLEVVPTFGYAHIVAYNNKKKWKDENGQWHETVVKEASFQPGWRGIVQLALRTNLYERLTVSEVYEGEIKYFNRFSDELVIDENGRKSDKIVGYLAYLRLKTGFEKYVYRTKEEIEKHGKTFSKTYDQPGSWWKKDFDAMAKKTVLKELLGKWGAKSVQMRDAINSDQAIFNANVVKNKDGEETLVISAPDYADNPQGDIEEAEVVVDEGAPAPTEEQKDTAKSRRNAAVAAAAEGFKDAPKETPQEGAKETELF